MDKLSERKWIPNGRDVVIFAIIASYCSVGRSQFLAPGQNISLQPFLKLIKLSPGVYFVMDARTPGLTNMIFWTPDWTGGNK